MLRVIIGFLKGAIVGGGIAYGAMALGLSDGLWAYLACALAGALVGVIAGRAPWRAETIWTPVIKMVAGGLIGAGLCFVGTRVLPDSSMQIANLTLGFHSALILAPAAALLYGIFVEVDDGSGDKKNDAKKKA